MEDLLNLFDLQSSVLKCTICLEQYAENRRPRTLKCGHTYCGVCLDQIIDHSSECPECRAYIDEDDSSGISVCYIALEVLRYLSKEHAQLTTSDTSNAQFTGCWKHNGDLKSFFCTKCCKFECRSCSVLDHTDNLGVCKIIPAKDGISVVKQRVQENVTVAVNAVFKVREKKDEIASIIEKKINIEKHHLEWLEKKIQIKKEQIIEFEKEKENLNEICSKLNPGMKALLDKFHTVWEIQEVKVLEDVVNECNMDIFHIKHGVSDVMMQLMKSQPFATLMNSRTYEPENYSKSNSDSRTRRRRPSNNNNDAEMEMLQQHHSSDESSDESVQDALDSVDHDEEDEEDDQDDDDNQERANDDQDDCCGASSSTNNQLIPASQSEDTQPSVPTSPRATSTPQPTTTTHSIFSNFQTPILSNSTISFSSIPTSSSSSIFSTLNLTTSSSAPTYSGFNHLLETIMSNSSQTNESSPSESLSNTVSSESTIIDNTSNSSVSVNVTEPINATSTLNLNQTSSQPIFIFGTPLQHNANSTDTSSNSTANNSLVTTFSFNQNNQSLPNNSGSCGQAIISACNAITNSQNNNADNTDVRTSVAEQTNVTVSEDSNMDISTSVVPLRNDTGLQSQISNQDESMEGEIPVSQIDIPSTNNDNTTLFVANGAESVVSNTATETSNSLTETNNATLVTSDVTSVLSNALSATSTSAAEANNVALVPSTASSLASTVTSLTSAPTFTFFSPTSTAVLRTSMTSVYSNPFSYDKNRSNIQQPLVFGSRNSNKIVSQTTTDRPVEIKFPTFVFRENNFNAFGARSSNNTFSLNPTTSASSLFSFGPSVNVSVNRPTYSFGDMPLSAVGSTLQSSGGEASTTDQERTQTQNESAPAIISTSEADNPQTGNVTSELTQETVNQNGERESASNTSRTDENNVEATSIASSSVSAVTTDNHIDVTFVETTIENTGHREAKSLVITCMPELSDKSLEELRLAYQSHQSKCKITDKNSLLLHPPFTNPLVFINSISDKYRSHVITCMPEYSSLSLEELRLQQRQLCDITDEEDAQASGQQVRSKYFLSYFTSADNNRKMIKVNRIKRSYQRMENQRSSGSTNSSEDAAMPEEAGAAALPDSIDESVEGATGVDNEEMQEDDESDNTI